MRSFLQLAAAMLLLALPAQAAENVNLTAGCGGSMEDTDAGIFIVEVSRADAKLPACAGFELKLAADGLVLRGPAIPAKFASKLATELPKLQFTAVQTATREKSDGTEEVVLKSGEVAKILVAPAGADPVGLEQLKKTKMPDGTFYY